MNHLSHSLTSVIIAHCYYNIINNQGWGSPSLINTLNRVMQISKTQHNSITPQPRAIRELDPHRRRAFKSGSLEDFH